MIQLFEKNDMNMPLNIEFYSYENELWYREPSGKTERLTERHHEIISSVLERIEHFYPKAYVALGKEYERCLPNLSLYRFRMVQRFCRCNFGNIDNVADIDSYGRFHLERVPCPLRGECRMEGIICSPEFNSRLSESELRVLKLWYQGFTKEEIAEDLYLSIHTVNNHIRNAFARLGLHEKAEFFRYAESNNLFK